ncbi:hypothetical protein KAOT1_13762 [Kordia algicida OT-1]|uniref:Uncharacterized protein n=1 Tax=Kordia algicida OT-1 TaxID=391587 RepID=A9DKA7_9FLAO|nr:hypothetical protein KAOT1_13762 [Kordia algicida OT-1]
MLPITPQAYFVGIVGFEPTQHYTTDLQSAPALQLWRIPKLYRQG